MGLRISYKDRCNHAGKWASHTDIGCHLRKVVVYKLTKKVFVGLHKKVLMYLCKKVLMGLRKKVFVCLYKKCLCVGEKICRKMVVWFQIYSA